MTVAFDFSSPDTSVELEELRPFKLGRERERERKKKNWVKLFKFQPRGLAWVSDLVDLNSA